MLKRYLPYQPPPDAGIEIVFEDPFLLIVNKPAGLLSTAGRSKELQDCLVTRLQKLHPNSLLIHRLDEATSGLMLFAKDQKTQSRMSWRFANRLVKKRYEAWVEGKVENEKGQINAPIAANWVNRPKQIIDLENGKEAITNFQLISFSDRLGQSRLALEPQTGRTHQLRVHLGHIGHFIVGDLLYGLPNSKVTRMMLHATTLEFEHPWQIGSPIIAKSPAPF